MSTTGTFTRRASTPDEIRARLDGARTALAEAAAGHSHEHPDFMWHALLVDHLNDEHGVDLPPYGGTLGTSDLDHAHAMAHELTDESGTLRLDSLAFLATVALVAVPVSLVAVFVGRLAGAVAGVA